MAMSDISLSDIAAVTDGGYRRGGGDGFGNGGNDVLWIFLLFALLGGFNGNRGFGGQGGSYGAGNIGGNEIYPWLNQAQLTTDGFRDQMINGTINGIQQGVNNLSTQLCNCCGDMQMSLANGFAGVQNSLCNGFNSVNVGMLNGFNGVEQGANARQIANMQQAFNAQTATMQGFSGVQAQTAQLASDIQLGNAQQTATILAENCADRAALSDGVRDIIANQNAGIQKIIDKLCDQELFAERRENDNLRQQLNMANLQASQAAQNTLITQGFANEVDALYNRLNNCPVPTTPVYGRTPIFTCNNNGCGCGCN